MRTTGTRVSFVVAALLAAVVTVGMAWAFGVPPDRHLYYAVLPTEEQNLAARAMVKVSRLSLTRLDRCPKDATQPETPIGFLVAAYRGQPDQEWFQDALRVLIRAGCDVNAYNRSGLTPLMNAALFNHTWIQQHLLSNGADAALRSMADGRLRGMNASEISASHR